MGTLSVKVTAADGGTDGSASATFDVTVTAHCAMPNFGTRRRIWTGVVTVGTGMGIVGTNSGYDSQATPALGMLNNNTFSVGTANSIISQIYILDAGNARFLIFQLSHHGVRPTLTQGSALRLHACDQDYDYSSRRGRESQLMWISFETKNLGYGQPPCGRTVTV